MERIKVYSISIAGLSQKFVHPSLRHPYDETALVTSNLSVGGRLAHQGKSIAWLDTRDLAERLLTYWMPQLKARWPNFEAKIFEEIASKDQIRWMKSTSTEAEDLLNNCEQCPAPRRKATENKETALALYLIAARVNNEIYYYAGKVKGNIRLCSSKSSAKRYKTFNASERIAATLPLIDHHKVYILTLKDDEALHLNEKTENEKKLYWDLQLGRH